MSSVREQTWLNNLAAAERPVERRALTAAAMPIALGDKVEARRLRVLRQAWQGDAAAYVDNVPELSFAYRFLAHASSRMRYYPALTNPEQPDGDPIPARDHPDAPPGLADDMEQAMSSFGVGREAMSPLQKSLSYQFGVPGECYLVGMQDPPQGSPQWAVRSIDEFQVFDDTYKLREVPLDPQGTLGWIDVDPATCYAARMWTPWWRYQTLATSPMRSLLDVAEELLLLSRDVRATARSRLAGSGIMKIPEGLRMMAMTEDNSDPEDEEWFGRFAAAMMTPLADEGVASSVIPIAISGEAEALAQLDHLVIDRPFSALAMELRAEAIGRIATGLDIPREVLEGISDPNHWGAWLVSDDTFRHHIEPQVITQVDAMTVAYMRAWLKAKGYNQHWLDRACIWYDPTALISKPDPMGNAIPLWDREAISNAALREAGGFTEDDAPDGLELVQRMALKVRTVPPNTYEAIVHRLDPTLLIPPIGQSGQLPGYTPAGAEEPTPPLAGPPTGPTPATTGAPPSGPPPPLPGLAGPPSTGPGLSGKPTAFTSGRRQTYERQSRKLTEMDAHLRAKIQVAACGAMIRLLDKAGAKLRTKVGARTFKDAALKASIVPVDNRYLYAHIVASGTTIEAFGFTNNHALLDADWSELEAQFKGWVQATQAQAVRLGAQMAGLAPSNPTVMAARGRLEESVDPAWEAFRQELDQIAERLLHNPDPGASDTLNIDPNTVVPVGAVRRALAIAGGGKPKGAALTAAADDPAGAPSDGGGLATIDVSQPTDVKVNAAEAMASVEIPDGGQIGSGQALGGMLVSAGLDMVGHEWVHGPSLRPFEPHLELDGVAFSSFTDPVLENTTGFPENEFYFPGDHDGCSCDFSTTWGDATDADDGDTGDDGTIDTTADTTPAEPSSAQMDLSADTGSSYLSQTIQSLLTPDGSTANLTAARAEAMEDVTSARDSALGQIETMGKVIARPPAGDTSGTYDWYRALSSDERDRLRNNGWIADGDTLSKPDQVVAGYVEATGARADATVDEAMSYWLDQTRIIDAGNLLENTGRVPTNLARFGNFNWDQLTSSNLSVKELFQTKDAATAYLSTTAKDAAYDLAQQELRTTYGQPIYTMTFSDYQEELSTVLDRVLNATPITSDAEFGDTFSPEDEAAFQRINELLPQSIIGDDTDVDDINATEVWAEAQYVANLAGLTETTGPGTVQLTEAGETLATGTAGR